MTRTAQTAYLVAANAKVELNKAQDHLDAICLRIRMGAVSPAAEFAARGDVETRQAEYRAAKAAYRAHLNQPVPTFFSDNGDLTAAISEALAAAPEGMTRRALIAELHNNELAGVELLALERLGIAYRLDRQRPDPPLWFLG